MTSTLITLLAGFGVALMVVGILEINRQRAKRYDRENFRRLVRYMTVMEQKQAAVVTWQYIGIVAMWATTMLWWAAGR